MTPRREAPREGSCTMKNKRRNFGFLVCSTALWSTSASIAFAIGWTGAGIAALICIALLFIALATTCRGLTNQ